jgi:hypothetical protein
MSVFGFIADIIWGVSEVFLFNERDRKSEKKGIRDPDAPDAAGRDEDRPADAKGE